MSLSFLSDNMVRLQLQEIIIHCDMTFASFSWYVCFFLGLERVFEMAGLPYFGGSGKGRSQKRLMIWRGDYVWRESYQSQVQSYLSQHLPLEDNTHQVGSSVQHSSFSLLVVFSTSLYLVITSAWEYILKRSHNRLDLRCCKLWLTI